MITKDTIIGDVIKENENAEEVEAYEEKIIKLLAEILMEIQE